MAANRYFQILRGLEDVTSKIVDSAAPYGLAMEVVDAGGDRANAIPAYGTGFEGFLLQEVTAAGPTALQLIAQLKSLPAQAEQAVSIARGEGRIEVEGPKLAGVANSSALIITSGTGAITSSTAKHTELSFRNGKWRVAQTGDRVCGEMLKANITPEVDSTNNVRCEIRVFRGGLKP